MNHLLTIMALAAASPDTCADSSFYDTRDSTEYSVVVINNIRWMQTNIDFETPAKSLAYVSWPTRDHAEEPEYGRLYTWYAAKDACPSGWRLPTIDEFRDLLTATDSWRNSGNLRKSGAYWRLDSAGLGGRDAYGFAAVSAGNRLPYGLDPHGGYYGEDGVLADFWTASVDPRTGYPLHVVMHYARPTQVLQGEFTAFRSVRCVLK